MADNADEIAYGTIHGYNESMESEQFGEDVEEIDKMVGKKRGHINIIVPPVPMKRHKRIIGTCGSQLVKTGGQGNQSDSSKSGQGKKVDITPTFTAKPHLKIDPKISAKPPLPPKPAKCAKKNAGTSPRMRVKVEESSTMTSQKLSAQAEQLRLEISELKSALAAERCAVRGLRAQHDSESRRLKADIKRLQDTLQSQKTSSLKKSCHQVVVSNDAHNQHELTRLNHEILSLKEAYKALEEKYQVSVC